MALTATPSGLQLRNNATGQSRANLYTIGTGYAANIGYGDAVLLHTDGTLNIATAGADILGMFAGVEYTDGTGKPTVSKNWVTGTAGTNIKAYVYDDADNLFEVQVAATGTGYVQTAIGAQANLVFNTPNATTSQSTSALNATLIAAASQGQFRIVGFGPEGIYDATTNPFPTVLVKIAQHQFIANKTAI
jgi:hypothetical protein